MRNEPVKQASSLLCCRSHSLLTDGGKVAGALHLRPARLCPTKGAGEAESAGRQELGGPRPQ